MPAAHISLVNAAGSTIRAVNSDEQSNFGFADIDPGSYQLVAEPPSLVYAVSNGAVSGAQQQSVVVQFQQIASAIQAVTVVASAPPALTRPRADHCGSTKFSTPILDVRALPFPYPGCRSRPLPGTSRLRNTSLPASQAITRVDRAIPSAGNFLYPNNLPTNAHGNGYADPNFLIALTIGWVSADGAAFNVREGNNSIDVVATYIPQPRFNSFVQLTGDYRDADITAGWTAEQSGHQCMDCGWVCFWKWLERLEHRQQYKLNGQREYHLGCHDLTLFGIGDYGFSYIPGMIPIGTPVPGDTIDNRQRDITHTVLLRATTGN